MYIVWIFLSHLIYSEDGRTLGSNEGLINLYSLNSGTNCSLNCTRGNLLFSIVLNFSFWNVPTKWGNWHEKSSQLTKIGTKGGRGVGFFGARDHYSAAYILSRIIPKKERNSHHSHTYTLREELTTVTQWNAADDDDHKWFPLHYIPPLQYVCSLCLKFSLGVEMRNYYLFVLLDLYVVV